MSGPRTVRGGGGRVRVDGSGGNAVRQRSRTASPASSSASSRIAWSIVISLQKLVPVGQTFFLTAVHDTIQQRQWRATIFQQTRWRISSFSGARITLTMKVRIPFQHNPGVGVIVRHHEGPGAYRPIIDTDIARTQSGLSIKLVNFPRHRRKKVHGQPVGKLRVLADQCDFQRLVIDRYRTREFQGIQVNPGPRIRLRRIFDRGGERLQTENMLCHRAINRRMHRRIGQPFDLINIILRLEHLGGRIRQSHWAHRGLQRTCLPGRQRHIT